MSLSHQAHFEMLGILRIEATQKEKITLSNFEIGKTLDRRTQQLLGAVHATQVTDTVTSGQGKLALVLSSYCRGES